MAYEVVISYGTMRKGEGLMDGGGGLKIFSPYGLSLRGSLGLKIFRPYGLRLLIVEH